MVDSTVRRGGMTILTAVCVALAVFFVFTALGVGHRARSARSSSSKGAPYAAYFQRAPHVLSTTAVYSLSDAPSPQRFPPPTFYFKDAIAAYRTYAGNQLGSMQAQIAALEASLAANDRTAAEAAWRAAYTRYLRLGAVYLSGQLAKLNHEIDGPASGLEGGVSNPQFIGLHRIEYGLWTGAPPRTLLGFARRLDVAVRALRKVLPSVASSPLEYGTRAHEILEDAQRDLLSGADVPWSGEGVLATHAGLEATEEVIATLRAPLLGEESLGAVVDTELAALRSAFASIAVAHHGRLPANQELTQQQSELLDGTLGGALEALSGVPGELETEPPTPVPAIPAKDVEIDP
jgi:iron uptake system EfeUOB component EfeO/EfeM